MNNSVKKTLLLSSILLMTAVILGAFGAHGLKNMVESKYIETYKTGVTYHYYHAFGLMFLGLLKHNFSKLSTSLSSILFLIGIILFSFNCYIYAITQNKVFAMIVPLGGLAFILGWLFLIISIFKYKEE